MKVLISASWLGGAGGAERALFSILRALRDDDVDVVVRKDLGGPYAVVPGRVRVRSLKEWRWRGAERSDGLPGLLSGRVLNPLRARLNPPYDVHYHLSAGCQVGAAARARVRLLNPAGLTIKPSEARAFDFLALESPDNSRFAPAGARRILLPPPLYDLSKTADDRDFDLPDAWYLTAFNPYRRVKGAEDLLLAADEAPHPIVWCHSKRTLDWTMPTGLSGHPNIIHVDDPTPAQLRYLYENCAAYVSFSRSEGFGWSVADALRYSGTIVSRPIGILSFPEARQSGFVPVGETWQVNWDALPAGSAAADRDLSWLSPAAFRSTLERLVASQR